MVGGLTNHQPWITRLGRVGMARSHQEDFDTQPLNLKCVWPMLSKPKPNLETSMLGDGEKFIRIGQNKKAEEQVFSDLP